MKDERRDAAYVRSGRAAWVVVAAVAAVLGALALFHQRDTHGPL